MGQIEGLEYFPDCFPSMINGRAWRKEGEIIFAYKPELKQQQYRIWLAVLLIQLKIGDKFLLVGKVIHHKFN